MIKKMPAYFRKGFVNQEILIGVALLAIIAVTAVAVFRSMANSVTLAKEAKLVSYAGQMRKMIDQANVLGSFSDVTTPNWSCLGSYSGQAGDFCWGDNNPGILNDANADNALRVVDTIPKGQMAPYIATYTRGAIFKVNAKTIEMKIYVGDAERAKIVCPQMNMVIDVSDNLSCTLPAPIVKN